MTVTNLFLLIDRTGSMASVWAETLSTINSFVKNLKNTEGVDLRINLAFFDRYLNEPTLQYKLIRSSDWTDLSENDSSISPRGMTPLLDAIGEFSQKVEEQKLKAGDLVQFVVMTDGQENCSKEYSREAIKAISDKFEKKEWSFQYLGGTPQAADYGRGLFGEVKTSGFDFKNLNATGDVLYASTMRYTRGGTVAAANFTDEEKSVISKDE